MKAGLTGIRHALPSAYVPSSQVSQNHQFDLEFVRGKLGIEGRYVLGPGETVSSLAANAVNKVLQDFEINPHDVGLLIVVTQTADYRIPHVSAMVQALCDISQDAVVMDINLGCSGYVIGLETAVSLMQSTRFNFGILVTVDAYSTIVDPLDRNTAPLFGDAATASLLSWKPRYTIGICDHGSDGLRYESLIARGSGSTAGGAPDPLYMDARGIFNFALQKVPSSVQRCLEVNKVEPEDIDLYVFHQANAFMLQALANRMGIPPEKVVMSMSDVGNTTSSSIPLALEREVLVKASDPTPVLISGFGVGLSWASTILFANEEIGSQ